MSTHNRPFQPPDAYEHVGNVVVKKDEPAPAPAPECAEGWKKLYLPLYVLCGRLGISVNQCKEKFGTLRFYVGSVPDELQPAIDDAINAAEERSAHVCEDCGQADNKIWSNAVPPGKWHWEGLVTTSATPPGTQYGWVRTLCKPCRTKVHGRPLP